MAPVLAPSARAWEYSGRTFGRELMKCHRRGLGMSRAKALGCQATTYAVLVTTSGSAYQWNCSGQHLVSVKGSQRHQAQPVQVTTDG